jgi:hypothetical protein
VPVLLAALALLAQDRPQVILTNPAAEAIFDLGGGSFVSFRLKDAELNPLRWLGPGDDKAANRPMAHFLCLDRWGPPSEAEQRNGMPFHGEATRVAWKLDSPSATSPANSAVMSATLPLAGLGVVRRIQLHSQSPLVTVEETVTNQNRLGKIYNMVQHPTIGPPFLDETTVVDSNARRGFMQSSPLPDPEEPSVFWPAALKDGQPVDLRHLRDDPLPNVVSYTIDQPIGWVTASNAKQQLMIGYLWKSSEYPWLNMWRHVDERRRPLARGLEFGTTGLHQPFADILKKGAIFGRPLFSYLDPGESISRSWAAFLISIPTGWRGVASVSLAEGRLTITERSVEKPRRLQLPASPPGF